MKRMHLLTAVTATALLLTACGANDKPAGQAGSGGQPAQGGTLYLLSDSPTQQYDPAKSSSHARYRLPNLVREHTQSQIGCALLRPFGNQLSHIAGHARYAL